MNYQDLSKQKPGAATGGIRQQIYIAPASYFQQLQTPQANVISAPHVLKPDKHFIEVYTTLDSGKLSSETVGSYGFRSQKFTLNCSHPGNHVDVQQFFATAINDDWIALVPLPSGDIVQLGQKGIWAQLSVSSDTGTLSAPVNQNNFTIEAIQPSAFFYPYEIPKAPEAIASANREAFDFVFRWDDQLELYFDENFTAGAAVYTSDDKLEHPDAGAGYYGEIDNQLYSFVMAYGRAYGILPVDGTEIENHNHTRISFDL